MPQRQVASSTLDVGRHSFGTFLDERMHELKLDLLRECDRIAASRELLLKKQLNEAQRLNDSLRAELQHVSKVAADSTLYLVGGENNESSINNPAAHDIGSIVIPEGNTGQFEGAADADKLLDTSPDEASLTCDQRENSEQLTLWGEWKDLVESSFTGRYEQDDARIEAVHTGVDLTLGKDLNLDSARSWCTINPNSTYVIAWEVFGIPILFYDLVTIPMQVFHKPEGLFFDFVGWVLILYWTADLFLRLLIIGHVTNDGIVKLDRRIFMIRYLRHSFAFDFFMVAPDWFSQIVGTGGMRNVAILRLFRILRLLRLMRMSKMKKLFRDLEDAIDSEYFTVGVSIITNLFAILGMCHYLGCFWFWVGTLDFEGRQSWVSQDILDEPWEYQYVISLHWAIAQFTPGASKIQPVNIFEAMAAILVLVFGLIFLSLFISALAQARAKLQALTSKIDRDNWTLRRYLRQQGVSIHLQVRAMKYVEKCLEPMFTRVQKKDVFLLPLLSRPLQLEVQQEQYYHTLIGHPVLKSLKERSLSLTLHLFMNVVIEFLLADHDQLFEVGAIAHEMYFVSRGTIKYIYGKRNVASISKGSWCTESVLWVEWVHRGTAKATADCQLISIDSAKMRIAVLETKERMYVSRCALAYLKDLLAILREGGAITDVTKITDDASSHYLEAIHGTKVDAKAITDEVSPAPVQITI